MITSSAVRSGLREPNPPWPGAEAAAAASSAAGTDVVAATSRNPFWTRLAVHRLPHRPRPDKPDLHGSPPAAADDLQNWQARSQPTCQFSRRGQLIGLGALHIPELVHLWEAAAPPTAGRQPDGAASACNLGLEARVHRSPAAAHRSREPRSRCGFRYQASVRSISTVAIIASRSRLGIPASSATVDPPAEVAHRPRAAAARIGILREAGTHRRGRLPAALRCNADAFVPARVSGVCRIRPVDVFIATRIRDAATR